MNSCQNCPNLSKSIFCNQYPSNQASYPVLKRQFHLNKGQSLFSNSYSLTGIYCLKKGSVKIMKSDSNGNETIVRIATPGDIIGEETFFDECDSEKTAMALSDSTVCYIDKNILYDLMEKKIINYNFLKKIYKTLNKAEEHIYSCHQKKVISRLAEFILEQKKQNGILDDHLWKIELNLNREELAMYVGTAPETIIRSLSDLKKMGVISGQKTIYINDEKNLAKIASRN